jgi:hypothetical protein
MCGHGRRSAGLFLFGDHHLARFFHSSSFYGTGSFPCPSRLPGRRTASFLSLSFFFLFFFESVWNSVGMDGPINLLPQSHGKSAPQATTTAPPSHFAAFESGGNSAAIVSLSLLHTRVFFFIPEASAYCTFLYDVGRFRFRTSRHHCALRCPHPSSLGLIDHFL